MNPFLARRGTRLIRRRSAGLAVGVVLMTAALGSSSLAVATPPTGTVTPSPTPLFIGTLEGPQKSKADGIELKTKGDVAVLDFTLTYGPNATSGWHEHPGIVIATVRSGSVVRSTGCEPGETFSVGDSFTEVGPHFVAAGPAGAELLITQIVPAEDANARRIDLPAPVC